jgi:ATP-dependent Clp protease ATP-binding subunit ClpX
MTSTNPIEICNFCGKHKDAVAKLIVGTDVAICNECVDLCQTLLDDGVAAEKPVSDVLDPADIKSYLDQHVVGQHRAKMVLSVAIVNHYKRINLGGQDQGIHKANILMLGPTGSGKTLLARTVAKYLDVPFIIGDATTLTEAGYVGDDVESLISRLFAAANYDRSRCERGIVFIDEIDKIGRKSESSSITRDVSGEGVQQSLLKLVEGTRCRVSVQGNRKHPAGDTVEIDTQHILFIAGGAFVGLDSIIGRRQRGSGMGFGAKLLRDGQASLGDAVPDDIMRFGMIPEFVGRFPVWVALEPLTKDDMIQILQDIKHSYVTQYQWLFEQDQVRLEFTSDALDQIAENTMANNTGARGLHSEIERVLMPHMYNLAKYRREGISEIVIDRDSVTTPGELHKAHG